MTTAAVSVVQTHVNILGRDSASARTEIQEGTSETSPFQVRTEMEIHAKIAAARVGSNCGEKLARARFEVGKHVVITNVVPPIAELLENDRIDFATAYQSYTKNIDGAYGR